VVRFKEPEKAKGDSMKEQVYKNFTVVGIVTVASILMLLAGQSHATNVGQRKDGCAHERLGQFSDWSEPVNLGPVVNSESNERHPAISPNGLSLYITSDRPGGLGGVDIWVSQRASTDDPWEPPENLGATINTAYNEGVPNLTPDGHWMYFNSNRPGGCGADDLYVSYRGDTSDDFAWEPAVNLGCQVNTEFDDDGPTYFEDNKTGTVTIYLNSNRPGGIGQANIYASTLGNDGTFAPATLVPELSSHATDGRTAIRRVGLEMFISSNRPGSLGSNDIWVSTRDSTLDSWSTPVNLGPPIDSGFSDGGAALSCDGTTMYFYSTRPGGFGGQDLYVTTRTALCDDNKGNGVSQQGNKKCDGK
jgi:hypothetical protein